MSKKWTPVLRGKTYCSPACGFNCRKSDYDTAVRRAEALCRKLGKGWKPQVWENAGWHFLVKKGKLEIFPSRRSLMGKPSYWAALQTDPQVTSPIVGSATEALRHVVSKTQLMIEDLTIAVSKVSGDAV